MKLKHLALGLGLCASTAAMSMTLNCETADKTFRAQYTFDYDGEQPIKDAEVFFKGKVYNLEHVEDPTLLSSDSAFFSGFYWIAKDGVILMNINKAGDRFVFAYDKEKNAKGLVETIVEYEENGKKVTLNIECKQTD